MASPPSPSSDDKKPTLKSLNICQVCGDNATIINYGALTCVSCRTFFRRNGFDIKEVAVCRRDGDCDVTVLTRKLCVPCRLAKCLAAGMSSDLIRKEDLSAKKRKFTMSDSHNVDVNQPIMTISQASALDLPPDGSQPHLNSSERNLISNVVHAFDTFSPVPEIRRTIERINTTASSLQFDLSRSLQLISSFSNSIQLFISSTPDFKVLTTSEQRSLLQRNMLGLLSVGGFYLMRQSGVFDKPENEKAVLPLYGYELIQKAKILSTQLDFDPTLIKLILVALAFSSNCFIKQGHGNIDKDSLLFGTYRLFGSQNAYAELIWKYLLDRYSYNESAQRFSILVKRLLDTIKLSIEIYENNQIFQTFIDDAIEQVGRSPIINDKTIIPLWGKN